MASIVFEKSLDFAVRISKLCDCLKKEIREYNIADQIFRSGTSIGANCSEGIYAQSNADFINKHYIALKEANETSYWLQLLLRTNRITEAEYNSLSSDLSKIIGMLVKIIKKSKEREITTLNP